MSNSSSYGSSRRRADVAYLSRLVAFRMATLSLKMQDMQSWQVSNSSRISERCSVSTESSGLNTSSDSSRTSRVPTRLGLCPDAICHTGEISEPTVAGLRSTHRCADPGQDLPEIEILELQSWTSLSSGNLRRYRSGLDRVQPRYCWPTF